MVKTEKRTPYAPRAPRYKARDDLRVACFHLLKAEHEMSIPHENPERSYKAALLSIELAEERIRWAKKEINGLMAARCGSDVTPR